MSDALGIDLYLHAMSDGETLAQPGASLGRRARLLVLSAILLTTFAAGAGVGWLSSRHDNGLTNESGEIARQKCRDAVRREFAGKSTELAALRFVDDYVVGSSDTSTSAAMISGSAIVMSTAGTEVARHTYNCVLHGYSDGGWGVMLRH